MISSIEQSTQALWYYNQSQIQRMKISKNHFKISESLCSDIIKIIYSVIQPFQILIMNRHINVYVMLTSYFNFQIRADWSMYKLVLFNMVQNAVKYNKLEGDIVILLSCKPISKKERKNLKGQENKRKNVFYMLETQIIDSGIGISLERQDLLFIPFLELKCMQGLMKKPENDNIGLGLAASKSITVEMGGDIRLKYSRKNLTVFQFKIPVKIENHNKISNSHFAIYLQSMN